MTSLRKIAEPVGMVAIILTLLFLAYELKRANDIAEAEAAAELSSSINEFLIATSENQEISVIWHTGMSDYDSLDENEARRFRDLLTYVFNTHQLAWVFYDQGIIGQDIHSDLTQTLCGVLSLHEDFAEMWANRNDGAQQRFYKHVADTCGLNVNQ